MPPPPWNSAWTFRAFFGLDVEVDVGGVLAAEDVLVAGVLEAGAGCVGVGAKTLTPFALAGAGAGSGAWAGG